jgi:transcriptional regulator with GAF, ATPase, and Fis domain
LRVLQESEFERLGSSKTVTVDVRVVAATSANLEKKIADGSFRADLYHRLNVVHLRVPPLRERPDDILPIAGGLLERFCQNTGSARQNDHDDAIHALISYSYPGNVRQLQNAMERAAIFSGRRRQNQARASARRIQDSNRNVSDSGAAAVISGVDSDEGIDFSASSRSSNANCCFRRSKKPAAQMQAAKLLNMKRTTLVEKIKRLQINIEEDENEEENSIVALD